jgi:hypothetical protein
MSERERKIINYKQDNNLKTTKKYFKKNKLL